MPFLPFNDEELKKKVNQDGQVNISGSSNTFNQSGQNVAAPKPVQRSGAWTNLNSYLDANKDNAESLGNAVASKISTSGNDARSGIENTVKDFNEQADKGTISNLSSAKQDADSIVGQAKSANHTSQINDDQVNRFKEVSNANYSGPNDLTYSQYYNDANSKLNKAKQYQTSAQSDEGRFSMLQDMFSRPNYSQGQKNLDNLLLTGNTQAKENIRSAAEGLNDLQSSWEKAMTDSTTLASQRKSESSAAKEYAQNKLLTNRGTRSQEVDSELQTQQQAWPEEYNQFLDLFKNYKGGQFELTQAQADKLGVKDGQRIYNVFKGVQPEAFLVQNTFDPNAAISKDQQAQLAALDKLGVTFGSAEMNKYRNPDLAGTISNSVDATAFGQNANDVENLFKQTAGKTNLSATSGPIDVDEWRYDASTNVGNYLNNGSGAFNYQGYLMDRPTGIGGKYADQAHALATQNLLSSINNWLNQQGYNNTVKIKT